MTFWKRQTYANPERTGGWREGERCEQLGHKALKQCNYSTSMVDIITHVNPKGALHQLWTPVQTMECGWEFACLCRYIDCDEYNVFWRQQHRMLCPVETRSHMTNVCASCSFGGKLQNDGWHPEAMGCANLSTSPLVQGGPPALIRAAGGCFSVFNLLRRLFNENFFIKACKNNGLLHLKTK